MTPSFTPVNLDFRVATGTSGPDITADVDPSNPASVSFAGAIRFGDAPADIVVSAAINTGVDHFEVRDLVVMDWVWEAVDTGDLPPGHHGPPPRRRVLEFASSHDGPGTVTVKAGQVLLVRVRYTAGAEPSVTSGDLAVAGDGWDPVHIPLLLTTFLAPAVLVVETRLLLDSLTVVAGRQAILPVEVKWISGPAGNIAFEKSQVFRDAQVTMAPVTVHVEPGSVATIPLFIQAAPDAGLGTFDLAIQQFVSRPPFNLGLKVTIVAAPPNPNPVGRVTPDCVFRDPPGSPVISPTAYGLISGFPRVPPQFTVQLVGGPGSGTLPTPGGQQSLLTQTDPPVPSALGAVIMQAFSLWGSAFPAGPKIAATLTSGVADIQINSGTLNANPSGGIAGSTRQFTQAEVDARGGREGVQISFESANFVWRPNTASILPGDPTNTLSLLGVAVHEIGHALGLLHNTNPASVMYHNSSLEILGGEDIAAINALYGWAPQRPVPGIGTEAGPAICACGATLVIAWRGIGDDHNLYVATSTDGLAWSSQTAVPGAASDDGPSLAYDGARLWMVWKGTTGDAGLYYATWDLTNSWSTPQNLQGTGSTDGPSIAIVSGVPIMVWKGVSGDSGLYYAAFDNALGRWDDQRNIGGVGSSDRPSVTTDPLSNAPRMVWKGVDGDQNLYTSELRGNWVPPVSDAFWLPQQQVSWIVAGNGTAGTVTTGLPGSAFGPGLVTAAGKILMTWRGIDQDQNLWFTQGAVDSPAGGPGPSIMQWSTQANVSRFATSNRPSVAVFKNAPFLVWKGVVGDRQIYTTTFG